MALQGLDVEAVGLGGEDEEGHHCHVRPCPEGIIILADVPHRRKKRQKKRQRSWLLFGGQNLFNSLPR